MVNEKTHKKVKREKIVKLLNKLMKAHEFYVAVDDNDYRIKAFEICEPVLEQLEALGVKRAFTETLLAYGDEFLVFEFGVGWDKVKEEFRAV